MLQIQKSEHTYCMCVEKAGFTSLHCTFGALEHGEVLMLQITNEQCNVCTLYVEPKPGGTKKDPSQNHKHDNRTIVIRSYIYCNLLDKHGVRSELTVN